MLESLIWHLFDQIIHLFWSWHRKTIILTLFLIWCESAVKLYQQVSVDINMLWLFVKASVLSISTAQYISLNMVLSKRQWCMMGRQSAGSLRTLPLRSKGLFDVCCSKHRQFSPDHSLLGAPTAIFTFILFITIQSYF